MFTGLIETIGTVAGVAETTGGRSVTIHSSLPTAELRLGDSIACDGACLTVTSLGEGRFSVDISHETIAHTTAGRWRVGERLHLERALRVGDRLDGHMVQGHVDGVGELVAREERGDNLGLWFHAPEAVRRFLVQRGSIAVAGVSLTITAVEDARFSVNLVPTTARETRLGQLLPGQAVNLEADIIGKYVERLLGAATPSAGGITMDKLARGGWL